jgi:hypothetical protein
MKRLFAELIEEVRRARPETLQSLRPGWSPEALRRRFDGLPYSIAPDAVSLYTWTDCTEADFELLPDTFLVPLERAFQDFESVHSRRAEFERIYNERYRDCFRFLTDHGAGGYAFGRVDSPSKGQIVMLCVHEQWELAFVDLKHLLQTSIACYRQGIMTAASGLPGPRAFLELAARMNPGMEAFKRYGP